MVCTRTAFLKGESPNVSAKGLSISNPPSQAPELTGRIAERSKHVLLLRAGFLPLTNKIKAKACV